MQNIVIVMIAINKKKVNHEALLQGCLLKIKIHGVRMLNMEKSLEQQIVILKQLLEYAEQDLKITTKQVCTCCRKTRADRCWKADEDGLCANFIWRGHSEV